MYRYDQHDQIFVEERVAQFRDQVRRRLAGEISEDEFKPLRLTNGLYLQLHAYMLRVAIPYGTLSSSQLRMLAQIARRYDRGYGHFTTRQNIQFNWIKLEDAPDVLADLATVQMHALQTSGNCIRNVTADQWAGAAADEIEDPRIYAEIIRQWSSLHPEFSFLPRKFKIAVTGSPNDRAAVRVHDIGLRMHHNADGEAGFEVIVGGGLGRTPMIGKTIRQFLPKGDLLSYLEAILRTYNLAGRRDNLYKSRIKIMVHEIGVEEMRRRVEAAWMDVRHGALELPPDVIADISRHFAPPAYETSGLEAQAVETRRFVDRDFGLWLKNCVAPHRQHGHAIVNLSLKPTGAPPGDASAAQMEAVADIADAYGLSEIRVSHEQNLVLPHVRRADLSLVYDALSRIGFATPNIGRIGDIIACPGLDYCSLANTRSIPIAQRISARFADIARQHEIGELKIKISGCINACGHHHVGHIGILGVDKGGEEFYQITVGGSAEDDTALGTIIGPAVAADRVVEAVEALVRTYLELRRPGERFLDSWRRLGSTAFKRDCVLLLRNGTVSEDPWQRIADDAPAPAEGQILVSLARLQADGGDLLRRRMRVGVAPRNHEPVEALAPFVHSLALIVLEFPKFTDGRAYSQARKLREHLAYAGELRAVGQVLRDQYLFMQRCGFDSLETDDHAAAGAWQQAQAQFTAFYQPAGDGRATVSQLRARLTRASPP